MKKIHESPEEELQTVYKRLLFHLENTPLGFIEWDHQLRVQTCSKRAEEIFGWTEEEMKSEGKTGFDRVDDQDLPIVSRLVEELIRGTTEKNSIQHRTITKDGRVIWCEWFNSVLKNNEGKVITIMSLVQDITQRKATEEKLKTVNHLYAFISQVNQTIVHIEDEKTLFRESCQMAIEFGKFKMAWVGIFDIENKKITLVEQYGVPSEAVMLFNNALYQHNGPQDQVLTTGSHFICTDFNGNLAVKDWGLFAAKYGIVSIMVLPIRKSGKIIGTFNLYSTEQSFSEKEEIDLLEELTGDISFALDLFEKEKKLKATEELVVNNEKKFRHTLDNILEGVQIHDFNWRYIYVNDASVNYSPFSREELIGYTLMEKYPGIEETELFKKMYHCMYERVAEHFKTEFIFPDGTKKYFELSIDPIPEGISVLSVDRTEQQRVEELLLSNEKRFRLLIENGSDMITLSTRSGKMLYGSPSITKVFGYLPDEIIDTFSFDFIHPDDLQSFIINRQKILDMPGETCCSQLRLRQKNGNWIWCEASLTNMLHEPGINALVSNFRDISGKRHAEKQLEFEKNNLQALINNTGDLLWSIDLNFKLITFNKPFYEIVKRVSQKDLLIGDSVFSAILSSEQLTRFKTAYNRAFSGEEFTDVEYVESPIQSWSEISYCPIREGNEVIGAACHSRDITERKKSEESLVKSESSLKEAQAIAQVGNWQIDLIRNEHIWSDEMFKLFGVKKSDVTPSEEAYSSFLYPDDRDYTTRRMEEATQSFQNSSFEFRFVRKDGVIRYGCSEWKFEFDGNKNPIRLFGIIQDITDRKLAETERTEMIDNLISRNNDLEQFTYIVSHNLRAPLANIIGIADLLNTTEMSAAEIKELTDGLNKSSAKLDNVVKDLNDVLQVRDTRDEKKQLVRFSTLVEDITDSIQKPFTANRVKITTDFSEVEDFFTIKSYLYSIFYNLISNSFKYHRKQGSSTIKISSHLVKDRIELIFKDNGLGIDLEKRGDQVFGLYKRFHTEIEGKGIGLFIVKTQVETLGGKISLKSKVNKGTEFKIEFKR